MGEKFIYVFSKEDRDKLVKSGLKLVGSYEKQDTYTYIFLNEPNKVLNFSLDEIRCCLSNKLTF